MPEYNRQTLKQLKHGELPFEQVRAIQSNHKDKQRFFEMLALAQEAVSWSDRILIPYAEHLYVVEKSDRSRVVKCDCGHEFVYTGAEPPSIPVSDMHNGYKKSKQIVGGVVLSFLILLAIVFSIVIRELDF